MVSLHPESARRPCIFVTNLTSRLSILYRIHSRMGPDSKAQVLICAKAQLVPCGELYNGSRRNEGPSYFDGIHVVTVAC